MFVTVVVLTLGACIWGGPVLQLTTQNQLDPVDPPWVPLGHQFRTQGSPRRPKGIPRVPQHAQMDTKGRRRMRKAPTRDQREPKVAPKAQESAQLHKLPLNRPSGRYW
jgi:hypothetical protein